MKPLEDIKEKIVNYGFLKQEYGYDEGRNNIIYPERLKEIDKALESILGEINGKERNNKEFSKDSKSD